MRPKEGLPSSEAGWILQGKSQNKFSGDYKHKGQGLKCLELFSGSANRKENEF